MRAIDSTKEENRDRAAQESIDGTAEETAKIAARPAEPITVDTIMSRWDYSSLRAYYMYKLKPGRMKKLMLLLAACGALVALGREGPLPEIVYQGGLFGLFVLAIILIRQDSNARKLEKPGKSIGHRLQRMTLSEDGLQVEWENYGIPLEYSWADVLLAAETENHFFFFVDKLAALVLPKREMGPEILSAIQELAGRKTGSC